jgi:hypothetical protein
MVASLSFSLVLKPGLSALYPYDEWGPPESTGHRNLMKHWGLREAPVQQRVAQTELSDRALWRHHA